MSQAAKKVGAALVAASIALSAGAAEAAQRSAAYVYSGLADFGSVFVAPVSRRLRDCGVDVVVVNHLAAPSTFASARARAGRVYFVGHSMGALAAIDGASYAAPRRVTVVTLDPPAWSSPSLPRNASGVNFWASGSGALVAGSKNIGVEGSNHVGLPSSVAARVAALVCGPRSKPTGGHHARPHQKVR